MGPVVQKLRQALLLVEGQRPAEERERRPPRVRSVQSGVASLRAAVRCRSRPGQRQASIMQLVWLKDIATESMMDEYCNRSATNSAPAQGNHPRRKILLPYYGRYSGRAHSLGRSNEEQAFSLMQGFVLPPRSVLFVREQTRQLFVHFLFVTRSHLESSSASATKPLHAHKRSHRLCHLHSVHLAFPAPNRVQLAWNLPRSARIHSQHVRRNQ